MSWRATPNTDSNRQEQQLSPSLPDDRVPRRGLAGLVAAGARRPTKTTPPPLPLPPSPMSFRMLSRRPRLLLLQRPRPTRCGMRVDSRRRRRRSSRARRSTSCPGAITKRAARPMWRLRDAPREGRSKRSSCACLGRATLRTTTAVLRVQEPLIHSMRSACSGTCGGTCR